LEIPLAQIDSDRENFIKVWSGVIERYTDDLFRYLEAIKDQIPNTSKTPFLFSFRWRSLSEFDWISLTLACDLLLDSSRFAELTDMAKWCFRELDDALERCSKRFLNIKYQKVLDQLFHSLIPENLATIDVSLFPAMQTWLGNMQRDIFKMLGGLFRITFIRERQLKRQERVRGYRDHGSMASVHEKARRAANTSTWNSYLEEIYQYCLATGETPQRALVVFNMSSRE